MYTLKCFYEVAFHWFNLKKKLKMFILSFFTIESVSSSPPAPFFFAVQLSGVVLLFILYVLFLVSCRNVSWLLIEA